MDRWLSRLSGSFFIVGFLLIYEVCNTVQGRGAPASQGRLALYLVGALCSIVLGMLGVRARHRKQD